MTPLSEGGRPSVAPFYLSINSWSLYPRQQLSSLLLNGASLSEKEKIQDDDVFALSESLTAFADASITSIDLSVNNIENNGAKALSAMMRVGPSVELRAPNTDVTCRARKR